ncbi:MAG: response regulator [Planctomycetes bacterium]|nr:response regulator [Planctomycetota bacterium]
MTTGPSVLLVGAPPDLSGQVRDDLIRRGFRAQDASDGFEAIEMLGREGADLLVVDLAMPGMRPRDALAGLRLARPSPPIVALLDHSASLEEELEAQENGASAVVRTPIEGSRLAETVTELLAGEPGGKRWR